MAVDDQILQQLVANQMGGAPAPAQAAAPAAPAPDPAAAPAPAPAPTAPAAPTATEKATEAAEPANKGAEPSFDFIEVDDGDGGKRQLTMQQIQGTMSRYRDLNHKWATEHAPMKPILDVAKQIMDAAKKNGYEPKSDEMAQFIQAAVKAYTSNPQMGQQPGKGKDPQPVEKPGAQAPMGEFDDNALAAWEKENAVSLPPGFKNMASGFQSMQGQLGQLMQMVQQMVNGAPAQRAAAQQQAAQQAQIQAGAAKQTIKNNLAQAMQQNQIPPTAEQEFMQFAMMRGYTPEDFVDPELTATVVADFKANKDAPEVARLRDIAQRRQAFTGRIEGAPGSAGGAPASAAKGADPMLSAMIESAMKR